MKGSFVYLLVLPGLFYIDLNIDHVALSLRSSGIYFRSLQSIQLCEYPLHSGPPQQIFGQARQLQWRPLSRRAAAAITAFLFSKSRQGPNLACLASRGGPALLQPPFIVVLTTKTRCLYKSQGLSTNWLYLDQNPVVPSSYFQHLFLPFCQAIVVRLSLMIENFVGLLGFSN